MEFFDAVVVGGGPAGSTAAEVLTRAGARVAVLDRARFPRVKLCAGWISQPIWDVLRLSPRSYPRGLWEWSRCHVWFGGRRHTINARGWFIRRYEFDDFLLERCGARVIEHAVKDIQRDGREWIVDGRFRARYLIGAGGTTCPVARALFPPRLRDPVGVQEREFEADPDQVAATRLGRDGEPELLLHDDLRGYSWNIPKSGWLNLGCGTVAAREVRDAWAQARDFFVAEGHVPTSARPELDRMKGWSYYLFDPSNLVGCERDGALLCGDALGLAQPLTAEGILPATLSGRLAAESILDGAPASYQQRLERHPILRDYRVMFELREAGARQVRHANGNPGGPGKAPSPIVTRAAAGAFAWLFAGKRLPAGRALEAVAGALARRPERSVHADQQVHR